jgi:uncharacterized membrane protein YkvA (DUF1232 family)
MSSDPFPRERVGALVSRLPRYAKLAWRLSRDPALSKVRRGAVLGAAAYVASPIDLLPGIIPGLGQLDDVVVAIAALRLALSGLDPERRRAHLAAAGLRDEDLLEDLRAAGATGAWALRAATRTALRLGRAVADAGSERVRQLPGVATRAGPPQMRQLQDAAAPAADRVRQLRDAVSPAADGARRLGDAAGPRLKAVRARLPLPRRSDDEQD